MGRNRRRKDGRIEKVTIGEEQCVLKIQHIGPLTTQIIHSNLSYYLATYTHIYARTTDRWQCRQRRGGERLTKQLLALAGCGT